MAPVRGGTRQEPLCARCLTPDPVFWGRCPACSQTWQLSPRPCQRCVLDQKIRGLLGDRAGTVRPDLAPLHQALSSVERPDTALVWMARPKVRELLSELGSQTRRLNDEILGELPADKTLAHMRSVLVAIGALPPATSGWLKLERWITAAISAREDPGERRILHGYAAGTTCAGSGTGRAPLTPPTCRSSTSAATSPPPPAPGLARRPGPGTFVLRAT